MEDGIVLAVHKTLFVRGDRDRFSRVVTLVTDQITGDWSRDVEAEERLRSDAPPPQRLYVFRRGSSAQLPAASLFLTQHDNALEVTNIVPQSTSPGSLTRDEYNRILDEFAARIAGPAASLGLELDVTPDRRAITDWMSAATAQRLRLFSGTANKGSGIGHPHDFGRWADFVIAAHRERSSLDSHTLQRWLIEEEDWPDGIAIRLAVDYEYARDLLKAYDTQR